MRRAPGDSVCDFRASPGPPPVSRWQAAEPDSARCPRLRSSAPAQHPAPVLPECVPTPAPRAVLSAPVNREDRGCSREKEVLISSVPRK